MQLRQATASETAAWLDDWRARLGLWYGRLDGPAEWAAGQVSSRVAAYETAQERAVFAITDAGQVAGVAAVSAAGQHGRREAVLHDIWINPAHRGRGHGTQALRAGEAWAREHDAVAAWTVTDPAEPAHAALFAGYPIRAYQMIKRLSAPAPLPEGLHGRPMTEAEFADWRARGVAGYTEQVAESGSLDAEAAAAQSAAEFDLLLPQGLGTANQTLLCLCAGDEVVATNWICHHRGPGMSWVYDVEVAEEHRGKGYGRAAMIVGEQATLDAGDSHLALNVFGQNSVAIGLYTAMRYLVYDEARSVDLEQHIQP